MIVIATLCLLLPGYLLARALRTPLAWPIAFPLSAAILTQIVIAYALLGIPLRFSYVFLSIFLVSMICAAIWRRQSREGSPIDRGATAQPMSRLLLVIVALQVVLVLSGMLFRGYMFPLNGWDTPFRWDALPRLFLQQESLEHFPPVTADDFTIYTYPEGVPPLTPIVYWWLYAGWGSALPALTSIAVLLQAATCIALVYLAARLLFDTLGALIAVAVLLSSSQLLGGFAMGQETGYTAVSFAGQILFALIAARQPRWQNVAIAGIFGGLGALSREYGPLLSMGGVIVLACQRETRRFLPLYCFVVAVLGAPWYLRNWAITGNPLYSMDLGFGFPVNRVYAGILALDNQAYGLRNFSAETWKRTGAALLVNSPLLLFIGISGLFLAGRRGIALGLCAALATLIWLKSVAYTSGGVEWSMRVLTPAWATLAIAAGAYGRLWNLPDATWKKALRATMLLLLVAGAGFGVLCSWAYPFTPDQLPQAMWTGRDDPVSGTGVALAKSLESSSLPATGVLTDDCYLAVALQRHSRFQPIMVWNPKVDFVFDHKLSAAEVRQRLIDNGVGLVSVWSTSPNNRYLVQFPFYHDDFKNWKSVTFVPNAEGIFLLPPKIQSNNELKPAP